MSLKLLIKQAILREQASEQKVNTAEKSCSFGREYASFSVAPKTDNYDSSKPILSRTISDPVDATVWLRSKLIVPCRIADVTCEWIRSIDKDTLGVPSTADQVQDQRTIEELKAARDKLGVIAYKGNDHHLWWRLPDVLAWLCRHCNRPLTIDDVCSSADGERTLTIWRCDPCQSVGVTPDAIRPPPLWVKKTTQ